MNHDSTAHPLMQFGENPPVPPLGIGIWAWGDRLFWGFGKSYGEGDLRQAYHATLDAGVRFFDTAEIYGFHRSERLLGRFMAETGTRPQIGSKFFPLPWRVSKPQFLAALRGSLRRLGLERLDLYQLHWPLPPRSIATWMDAMADAHEAGLLSAIGVSNCNIRQTEEAQAALQGRGLRLASNQVEYSLLQRGPERSGLLDACRDMGVVLIAYSPLAQGMLTGKYGPGKPLPRIRGRHYNHRLDAIEPLVQKLRDIGEAEGKTPAQVALNWAMCKGAFVIPGAKNARQAAQNAGALGWRLGEETIAELDELSARLA